MRRCILAVLVVLIAAPGPAQSAAPTRLVTFGHSFVSGRVPDPSVTPWPDRLAGTLKLALLNRAVSGAESSLIATNVISYEPLAGDVVVVEPAINDVREFGTRGLRRYRRALRSIGRHLTHGVRPHRTVFALDPPIADWRSRARYRRGSRKVLRAYGRATRRIAARFQVGFVDLGRGWKVPRDISADGLHPSEAGTQRIADAIVTHLGP